MDRQIAEVAISDEGGKKQPQEGILRRKLDGL